MKDEKMGPGAFLMGLGSMLLSLILMAAVCGPVMGLLGFRYESTGGFIRYFLLSSLISWPLGLGALAALRALKPTGRDAVLLYLPLDTLASLLGFMTADHLMADVTGNALSLAVASLVFALPGLSELKKWTNEA